MTTVGLQNNTNGTNGSTDGGDGDGVGGGGGGGKQGNIYDYPTHKNVALVITWVELVLMLILNGLVIAGLLCRRRRNRLSFFVLHLALTDFGLGLFYLLPDAITRTTEQWYAGETVCIMYQYISHVMTYVSSFMIVVICLDRLYLILQPLRSSRRGMKYRYSLLGVAWFIPLLLAIPQPMNSGLIELNGKEHCDLMYTSIEVVKVAIVIFVCGAMFVPAIIICVCYTFIAYFIWMRLKSGMQIAPKKTRNSTDLDQLDDQSGSDIMSRRKIKNIIMIFVVVIVFILCWSPLCFNLLLTVFGNVEGEHYYILMALAPLNSAANPIIFLAFNWKYLQKKNRFPTSGIATTTRSLSLLQPKGMMMRRIPNDNQSETKRDDNAKYSER